jgi:hypothetical protein
MLLIHRSWEDAHTLRVVKAFRRRLHHCRYYRPPNQSVALPAPVRLRSVQCEPQQRILPSGRPNQQERLSGTSRLISSR